MSGEGLTLRPEVAAFALLMERELRANDHKPGWKQDTPEDLLPRVEQEASELRDAVNRLRRVVWVPRDRSRASGWFRHNPRTGAEEMGNGYEDVPEPERSERVAIVASEAADVANMAMMVADVCGVLPALLSEDGLSGTIAAIIREPGGELLDKLLRIGDLVGVPRPPQHVSPIRMNEDVA